MTKPTFQGSLMFASDYVCAEELKGRDVNVIIDNITKAKLKTNTGRMEDKFLLHFKGAGKPLVLNRTNARTIAEMHGSAAEQWKGKRVTLYPTTCEAFGKTTTCIRIRDKSPDDTRQPVDGLPPNGHDAEPEASPDADNFADEMGDAIE